MSDQTSNLLASPHSDSSLKRKREMEDHLDAGRMTRPSHGPNGNGGMQGYEHHEHHEHHEHDLGGPPGELSQIDQQLLQHVGQQNGVHDDNALAAKAALAAQTPQKYPPPPEGVYDSALTHSLAFAPDMGQGQLGDVHNSTAAAVYAAREAQSMGSATKPAVGSDEWHQLRKNNHKEVERRRRETINEGINEIAKLVPGCEKNKGSILQRASAYITELSEKLKAVQETWNREKLVANTAITEISTSNTKIKIEANRRGAVAKKWLERCRAAGVKCDDYDEDLDGLHDLHIEPGV